MAVSQDKLGFWEGFLVIVGFQIVALAMSYIVLTHVILPSYYYHIDPVSQYHHNECVNPAVPQ